MVRAERSRKKFCASADMPSKSRLRRSLFRDFHAVETCLFAWDAREGKFSHCFEIVRT